MLDRLFRLIEDRGPQMLQFVNDDAAQQQMVVGRLDQALDTVNALLLDRPDDDRVKRLRDQIAASEVQLEANVKLTTARAAEFVAFMRGLM